MPEVQVSVVLPYFLRLNAGDYPTASVGEVVQVLARLLLEDVPPRTPVRAHFTHDDIPDPSAIRLQQVRDAEQFLRRINRLLRWYRAVSRRAEVTEITRAQASPFHFEFLGGETPPAWLVPM